MADTKITALTAIGANPIIPSTFPIPMVDLTDTSMAASGTTKKVTVNQILQAGGTATLASATITGNLTVQTNKLAVTNTGVGFGMTPITPFSGVVGTTGAVFFRTTDPAAPVASPYIQAPTSTGFSSISSVYGFWYQGCGIGNPALNNVSVITDSTERLRIDSTGNVGIGVAPSAWNSNYNALDIGQNGAISGRLGTSNTVDIVSNGYRNSAGDWVYKLATSNTACRYQLDGSTGGHIWYSGAAGTAGNTIAGFSTATMTLDASGRLIINSSTFITPTLNTNGEFNFMPTSNTNVRFSYRGTDGVTRTADITLA